MVATTQHASAADPPPEVRDDALDILVGLTAPQKRLSPKYFYDERGSELFDKICELPEYYPTRTERALLEEHLDEVADLVGPDAAVIELGAGSNHKIRMLLDHLTHPVAYVPVDISADYLLRQAGELAGDYPEVHVQPVCADFTRPFELPEHPVMPAHNLLFFPGSTIGNFSRAEALRLLHVMALEAKPGGSLLIGVDLRKDPAVVLAAYNDAAGVTAEFNLNVLRRLNRELGGDFHLQNFRHRAVYDEARSRVEMRLVSTKPQRVSLAGVELFFDRGEYIVTEHSHKYSVEEFRDLARRAGFSPERTWTDERNLFSVHYLRVPQVG